MGLRGVASRDHDARHRCSDSAMIASGNGRVFGFNIPTMLRCLLRFFVDRRFLSDARKPVTTTCSLTLLLLGCSAAGAAAGAGRGSGGGCRADACPQAASSAMAGQGQKKWFAVTTDLLPHC